MIAYTQGDLFDADAEALVNPVDCTGVSGAGLAREMARRFPWAQDALRRAASVGGIRPGQVFAVEGPGTIHRWIVHFPTKRHWRDPSRVEDIEAGVESLVRWAGRSGAQTVAVPALGCGLGGLRWEEEVRPLLWVHLACVLGVTFLLYEPWGPKTPDGR